MIRTRQLLTLVAAAALAACTLEPTYHRPGSSIQNTWPTGPAYAAAHPQPKSATPAADIGWQDFFVDPQLRAAIKLGLENNRDLRVAALKVEKAQAQYRIQRGALFPSISANAADTVQHVSARARTGFGSGGTTFRTFTAGIGFASYELDFFGRIRSLDHKQLQLYMSQIEARKSAQISLVSQIANDYVVYLADLRLAQLARKTYKNQQKAYSLSKQSYDAGVATALDLSQAEQAMDAAHADVAKYTRIVAQARNLLIPLLGATPPASILEPRTSLAKERFLEALPAGLPSDLLSRRPDILEAEHNLKAANANIGAARAAFFPSISLTGSFGTASSQLSGLFANNSEQWTFAPTISVPIFSAGRNIANLDLTKIEKKIAIAQYQKAIQTAFKEVADGLAARGTLNQQLEAQQQLAHAARHSYDLAQARYRQGVDNYLAVLTSQRAAYQSRQNLIQVRLARLQNLITLYTALGGGWKTQTAPDRSPSQKTPADTVADPATPMARHDNSPSAKKAAAKQATSEPATA